MKRMRVYVAVCLTHRRNRELARSICEFLTGMDAEITSPWVAEEDAKQGLDPKQVYHRDVAALAASDAVVAEVSTPSHGVGMELMAALSAEIPIACLYEKGKSVSWMVLGAPEVCLVDYPSGNIDEGLKKIVVWLFSFPPGSEYEDIDL